MTWHDAAVCRLTIALVGALAVSPGAPQCAIAQTSLSDLLRRPSTPEGKPKTFLDETMLYGYAENSYVVNLGRAGRGGVNELRFYDVDEGYTFNAFELSLKKDPSEAHRFGFGAVLTAGRDSQKNHSLGIFRDRDDPPPYYRNTPEVDVVEAYVAYLVPIGNGLTLKAGRWGTLIGYEVYESPKNFDFSRSFLYTIGTPYTHTGWLATYPFTPWFSLTAGFTNGWDNSDNNNGYFRPIGSFVFTPTKTLTANVNWLFGPEQNRNQMDGGINQRWIVDNTLVYTGVDRLTLALNFDLAGEESEPSLVAAATRRDKDALWGGIAGYAVYEWRKWLRTALRAEYFADPEGVRNGIRRPGQTLDLWEVTATAEFHVWRGLQFLLEYRHDWANQKAFSVHRGEPTSKTQDTFSIVLRSIFF
jgi:Putative beta-barrel porin-2, OmpL-like. bbp2